MSCLPLVSDIWRFACALVVRVETGFRVKGLGFRVWGTLNAKPNCDPEV